MDFRTSASMWQSPVASASRPGDDLDGGVAHDLGAARRRGQAAAVGHVRHRGRGDIGLGPKAIHPIPASANSAAQPSDSSVIPYLDSV